ncbi:Sad1 / UNC-like C-terminal [Teratosphaeria destructans]|uniref:Sad1 / UNC-like C-terminal n=1 Tax=Teratosphaeria destructans TaxID=418781 RepID=A0A9W7W6L9_9PEZI|nr:Sad1 / UNC-like C-terminal [Teratosphaeria destructans]
MSQTPGGRITRSRSQTPAAVPTISVGSSTAYGAPGRANLRTQVTSERQSLTTALQAAKTSKTANRAGSQAPTRVTDEDIINTTRDSKTPSRRGRPRGSKRPEPAIEEEPEDEQPAEELDSEADDAAPRRTTGARASQPLVDSNGVPSQNYSTAQMTGRGTFTGPVGRLTGAAAAAAKPLFRSPQGRVIYRTLIENDADYGQVDQQQQAAQPKKTRVNPDRTEFEPSYMETFLLTLQRWTPLVMLHATSRAAKALVLLWWAFLTLLAISTGLGLIGSVLYSIFLLLSAVPSVKVSYTPATESQHPVGIAQMSSMWERYFEHHNSSDDPVNDAVLHQGQIMIAVTDFMEHVTNLAKAVNTTQGQATDLAERVFTMQGQLEAFKQQILPSLVAVTKDENGDLHLPEHFIQALSAELKQPNSTLYTAFLETNKAQIEALLDGEVESSVHGKLREQMHIISREMVQDALDARYQRWESGLSSKMLETVKQEVESQLQRTPGLTADFFGQRNYFAYNAGAQIDVRRTSPTYIHDSSWRARKPNEPATALTKWEEAGECWCGANNTGGFLQLGIRLRRPVVARDVFIEHISRTMTDDIAAAPREVEFWGEGVGAIQPQDSLCKTSPPTEKHVCLGAGEYDIHGWNWVQRFPLGDVGSAVDSVVIRALSNWGADHTCIYRPLFEEMEDVDFDATEGNNAEIGDAKDVSFGIE